MGRRNQKGKTGGKMEEGGSGSDDEGSMFNDNASMTSEASSFAPEIEDSGSNGVDESSKIEMFESKLREALELATQKSAAGRVKALEAICGAFLKRYCPDFVENQQVVMNITLQYNTNNYERNWILSLLSGYTMSPLV